ncbi:MAG TPA: sensor histidine kinase [Bryobacteraceae bacterium]|nr:sensor histidine kinase [Bryobacteraceae bacterium]
MRTAASSPLFGSDHWSRALESYAKATQLTIKMFDVDAAQILGPVHATPLFQLFEEKGYDPGIFMECAQRCLSQTTDVRPAVMVSEFCGLAVIGTSLVLDDQIVGAAVGGYVLVDFCQASEAQRLAQNSGIKFERLWRVTREQKPVPKQRLLLDGELLQVLGDAILKENSRTRQYGTALSQTEAQLRALTARLLTSQEEERRRLARELHDDVIQRVAALQNQVVRLRLGAEGSVDGRTDKELEVIENGLATMADDMRSLSHGLHPSILDDLGLEAGLKQLVDAFREQTSQSAQFKAQDIPNTIPQVNATTLYRIAQEALNNARKHAVNSSVVVTLSGSSTELRLMIEDDGPGFNSSHTARGLGLISMRERADLVGGRVIVTGRPGRGTQVEAIIPMCENL